MKTVSFVCEKGGVGKTALSEELFYFFQRRKIPVSLYSMDGQYADRGHVVDDAEVAIVDMPGSLNDTFRDIVAKSDVVVIPVRPGVNDVEPFLRTVSLVKDISDAELLVVLNAMTPYTMSAEFLDWLNAQDLGCEIMTVPQSEAFARSIGSGASVVGRDRLGKLSAALQRMSWQVYRMLGYKDERGGRS